MALVRFDPFADLFAPTASHLVGPDRYLPPTDIVRTDEAFLVRMDVPGVAQDAVEVSVEDGRLTVSGSRADDVKAGRPDDGSTPQARYARRERHVGRFTRTFTLGDGVAADLITANLEHGVLELRIPHAPEAAPRQIPVTVTA